MLDAPDTRPEVLQKLNTVRWHPDSPDWRLQCDLWSSPPPVNASTLSTLFSRRRHRIVDGMILNNAGVTLKSGLHLAWNTLSAIQIVVWPRSKSLLEVTLSIRSSRVRHDSLPIQFKAIFPQSWTSRSFPIQRSSSGCYLALKDFIQIIPILDFYTSLQDLNPIHELQLHPPELSPRWDIKAIPTASSRPKFSNNASLLQTLKVQRLFATLDHSAAALVIPYLVVDEHLTPDAVKLLAHHLNTLSALSSLSFAGACTLKNADPLTPLFNISSLSLARCASLKNIEQLGALVQLRTLNLQHCDALQSLDGLETLVNLKALNLTGCSGLKSAHPLTHLPSLTDLKLQWLPVFDDTSLQQLDQLEHLDLSGSTFKSLPDVQACLPLSLPHLSLRECTSLNQLDGIEHLSRLKTLILKDCATLTKITPLAQLSRLLLLDLSGCHEITNISPLASLNRLNSLALSHCNTLRDITPLSSLLELKSLELVACRSLTHLPDLKACHRLSALNLSDCSNLESISGLRHHKSLAHLDLSWCRSLTNLSPLTTLPNLTWVNLSNCASIPEPLQRVWGAEHIPDLKALLSPSHRQ